MLIAFRVGNFRSLRDESELTLVVPSWVDAGDQVAIPLEGSSSIRVGTVAGIYGANASGKTNVLRALWMMRSAVVNSHQRWKPSRGVPYSPFFGPTHGAEPSTFEAEILLDGERFTYGFKHNAARILQEWLYSYPFNRRRVWFERDSDTDGEFYFGKALRGRPANIAELTRENSLFLSAAAANNHPQLGRIFEWFDQNMVRSAPGDHTSNLSFTIHLLTHPEQRGRIVEMLRFADLGVTDVQPSPNKMVEEYRERLATAIRALNSDIDDETVEAMIAEASDSVEFVHQVDDKGTATLSLPDESDGTQKWLGLIGPILSVLKRGAVLIVDELDSSLHPKMVTEVIRLFHDPELNNSGAQLIFNTHDPSLIGTLLGDSPLRRDEIWLTEKDKSGATHLYPLTEFRPRKAENLERGYLQGRYGGIPFLDRSHLFAGVGANEPRSTDGRQED